ncbi:MAG TPA: tripartite tricarboxylate transporter substrate-binding protein [Burkholderiales bacterium]|nr:tripartite tricarboxylate transporter substrate-binding protein [Burkholderiales bacterium]
MKHATALLLFSIASLSALGASAQGYPDRPIRVLVAQSAGSSLDTLSRILTSKIGEFYGQQLVVDNRGGAAGTIAVEIAARAPADGYTILVGASSSLIVSRFTYRQLAFDAFKDFDAISLFAIADGVMAVNPGVQAKTVKELVALARAQPGKLNMSSAGMGSSSHLSGIMFANLAGINTVHIPYKGGGPMAAAVVTGESHWLIAPAASLMGHVKAGRLRALAITSKTRSPLLDLPTIAEAGVPGYEFNSWNGIFAPKGTPRSIIRSWHETTQKTLGSADVKTQFANQGVVPTGSASPAEFDKFFRSDYDRLAKLVKTAGIKPE